MRLVTFFSFLKKDSLKELRFGRNPIFDWLFLCFVSAAIFLLIGGMAALRFYRLSDSSTGLSDKKASSGDFVTAIDVPALEKALAFFGEKEKVFDEVKKGGGGPFPDPARR